MNLGQFQALVSSTCNRGTTLDARIPAQVQMAALWLERNYTFKYMERFRLLQVVTGKRTVALPTNGLIKGFKFLRFVNTDASYLYLNKVEAADLSGSSWQQSSSGTLFPANYWIVANRTLVLGYDPTVNLNGEAMWYEYTDWPTDPASQHELLSLATDVLLAQTMLFMASFVTRDARMFQVWKQVRDEGVNTMTRAEDEVKFGGQSITMAPPVI